MILTKEGASTRFHACERFDRCEYVQVDGRASHTEKGTHVVYINPVNMGSDKWKAYVQDTTDKLTKGARVDHLVSK